MRKGLLIFFILIVLSGCSFKKIDNYSYDKLINEILSFNIKMLNKVGRGYKYYTPKGVVRTCSNSYNDILKRDNVYYYLYVDIVSYYYGDKVDYEVKKNVYYSYVIDSKKSNGYVEVENDNNKLYVKMYYNYAKIEAYTDKENLKQTITDMSYILSSIKFNDSLLKKMYESGNLASKEEVYKLFENKGKEGNFLDYIKEYDKYEATTDQEIKEEEFKIETTTSSNNLKDNIVTSKE